MASVVINEFEVLRETAQPASAGAKPAANDEGGVPDPPDPHDVRAALQLLQSQAMRVWAH
jgi:hypothetical protein